MNKTDPNSYEERRRLKTTTSKRSIHIIKETEENEKTISKPNFIPTILKRDNKLIQDKLARNKNTVRRFLLNKNIQNLNISPPNLTTIHNYSSSVKEKSGRMTKKNSQG
jgi:hypothetical protein